MKAVAAGLLVVVIVVVSAGLGWVAGTEKLGKGEPEMTTEFDMTDDQKRSIERTKQRREAFGQWLDQLENDYPSPGSAYSIDQSRRRLIEAEMWAIRSIVIDGNARLMTDGG